MQRPNGSKYARGVLRELCSSRKFLEALSSHPKLLATMVGRLIEK